MELTHEMLEKAKNTKSAEELMNLAKENDFALAEEEAKAYFKQIHKTGEMSDDELNNVAGGGCYKKDGYLPIGNGCDFYEENPDESGVKGICGTCKYCDKKHGTLGQPLRCIHPSHRRDD